MCSYMQIPIRMRFYVQCWHIHIDCFRLKEQKKKNILSLQTPGGTVVQGLSTSIPSHTECAPHFTEERKLSSCRPGR